MANDRVSKEGRFGQWLFAALGSALLAVALGTATGLIEFPGKLFSQSSAPAKQVEALLHGRLTLGESVASVEYDMVWERGGVQQVWGLGVPLWRLAFEFPSRTFFGVRFPDRLCFLTAYAIVAFYALNWILKLIRESAGASSTHGGAALKRADEGKLMEDIVAVVVLVLSPFFMNLLRMRFLVYEEVIAYGYLISVLQVLGLSQVLAREYHRLPMLQASTLAFLAGCGPLIRPTLIFYGGATMLVLLLCLNSKRFEARRSVLLLLWFSVPMALLLMTNYSRFGSPLEFGHSLNLQTMSGSMYLTRFENTFQQAPFLDAALELIGSLFSVSRLNGTDYFGRDIVRWQAGWQRWREFNFSTFDWTAAILALFGVGFAVLRTVKRFMQAGGSVSLRSARLQIATSRHGFWTSLGVVWAVIALFGLGSFYAYVPVNSARYMYDFAAGLSALIAAAFCFAIHRFRFPAIVTFLIWSSYEIIRFEMAGGHPRALTREEAIEALGTKKQGAIVHELPDTFTLGIKSESLPPFCLVGWDQNTGDCRGIVITYFEVPQFIRLRVKVPAGMPFRPDHIRCRIGLEELHQNGHSLEDGVLTLTFRPARRDRLREGVQVSFLSFMDPDRIGDGKSGWQLLSIENLKPEQIDP
ncbi:MAG: hypothetical protein AAB466_02525 [Verrucomicrobiota bacterium]